MNRGLAYEEKGDHDKAVADFDKVLALNANDAGAYLYRGIAYAGKGDYSPRLPTSTRSPSSRPKRPSLTTIAAWCWQSRATRPEQLPSCGSVSS